MHITIFGLTISSSWGNGHATLWRGLCRALVRRGHRITFFEKDVPYYRQHRDLERLDGVDLVLYPEWAEIADLARRKCAESDVAMVTSYCADGAAACALVLDSAARLKTFYDLDTPVTLEHLALGDRVPYLPEGGLAGFDLVLSYTGGSALTELRTRLGAKRVAPLYGSVDPEVHTPVPVNTHYASDLSYLGTYAADRQEKLERLFLAPARALENRRFTMAGSCYPADFPWTENLFYFRHLPPSEHAPFFASSRLTLNLTRGAMAKYGFCPSGRLFEAAASGVPLLTDDWDGLDLFFGPGEVRRVANTEDVIAAVQLSDEELRRQARAARERVLSAHTADHRAVELEELLESALAHTRPLRWGLIPAAGAGTRIQPLAFSKELLPVGSRIDDGVERPRAVSEFLVERMIAGGANRMCFVLSPGKSDIFEYYCGGYDGADFCYVVQPRPQGLCDALFRAIPLVHSEDIVMVGLPDTIWFPVDGFARLDESTLSFLLFKVDRPEVFDAVVTDGRGLVQEIQVKSSQPKTDWVWGAFQMPGHVFQELHDLWLRRDKQDEYFGTLVNAYLAGGHVATGVKAGEIYVDVGTLNGYREASRVLASRRPDTVTMHRTQRTHRTSIIAPGL